MSLFNRFRLSTYLAGAVVAGLLAFAAPAFAQEQAAATAAASSEAASDAPRGFIAQPSDPVNVGNPAAAVGPEQRVALVIGNSNYREVAQLPNPANDARSMAQLLNQAGFEVIQATDLSHDEMIQVLRSFSAKIGERGPNTVAMVYYAGHGVQVAGDNYLIPVDARISGEGDLPAAGIRLVDVMATLQAVPSRMRIVVVDACRNNPFNTLHEASRGLAIVDAPNGSIVGYSTAPGTEALDGQGTNSPYANAFLKLARQPNVPIEQFFKNVRLEVNQETAGRQTPWESSSLTSNFTFFGDTMRVASQQPVREAYSSASMQTRGAHDGYRYAMATDSVQAYQDFVAFYPTDPYCEHIRALLAAKLIALAWHEAVILNSPFAYQNFYKQYPTSPYANLALKLQTQPKILPLDQPTDNFAPANFAAQVKSIHSNQIGLNGQGEGHGPALGNGLGVNLGAGLGDKGVSPLNPAQGNPSTGIKTIAPGVDLAKTDPGNKTDLGNKLGLKLDPAATNNRVTTLPGNVVKPTGTGLGGDRGNTGIVPVDRVKPVLSTTGSSLDHGDRIPLNNEGRGNGIKTITTTNNGPAFHPIAKLTTPPATTVLKTNTGNGAMPIRQPMTVNRNLGGGNGGGMMMRSFH